MGKATEKQIRITKDGPYELIGDIEIDQAIIQSDENGGSTGWKKGAAYPEREKPVYLCRCGHSRDKPYCDGSHDDAGFCGHEHANRAPYSESAQLIDGETVNLMDDQSLCIGARFCDVGESVWGYVEKSATPGYAEKAAFEACNCPSGRLTVVDAEGKGIEPKLEQSISLVEDPVNDCRGPLWVKGGIEITGCNGEHYETRNRVTLCRCGESKNQPYCDGNHYNCEHMQGLD